MRVFRDLLDNSCPGCSCCGDGAQPTFLPSWCGSCIWVLWSWMHCPTSTLCSATTKKDIPSSWSVQFSPDQTRRRDICPLLWLTNKPLHAKDNGLVLVRVPQSLSRLFYITGQFTYVPYFHTWRRMQQFFFNNGTYLCCYILSHSWRGYSHSYPRKSLKHRRECVSCILFLLRWV